MLTENLSTLKIHKLTQEQYNRELAAGNIDETALYLTPEEKIDLNEYCVSNAIKRYRPALDTGLGPWKATSINNVKCAPDGFDAYNISTIDNSTVDTQTEILLGTVTFVDCEYGYMIYGLPTNPYLRFEMRCGEIVHEMVNNYTINKYTNNLWETDFENKTYEIYVVVLEGFCTEFGNGDISINGLIYECMSIHDIRADNIEQFAESLLYNSPVTMLTDGVHGGENVTIIAENTTVNNVAFTVNEDNSVTINGVASDDIIYEYCTTTICGRNWMGINDGHVILKPSLNPKYISVGLKNLLDDNDEKYYVLPSNGKVVFSNIKHPYVNQSNNFDDYKVYFMIPSGAELNNINMYYDECDVMYTLSNAVQKNLDDIYSLTKIVDDKFDNALTYNVNDENLFPFDNIESPQTNNGITMTVNEDMSITLNGTATGESWFDLGSMPESLYADNYGFMVQNISDNSNSDIKLGLSSGGLSGTGQISHSFNEEPSHIHSSSYLFDEYYRYLSIYVPNSTTINNYTLKPVIYKCKSVHNVIQNHEDTITSLNDKIGTESVATQINNALENFSSGKSLTEHLSEENMVLTNLQYGDTLPDPGTPGRIFFLKVSKSTNT